MIRNCALACVLLWSCFAVSGCGTMIVGGAAVSTVSTGGKLATRGAVGAGSLAVRGTSATLRGTARALGPDKDERRGERNRDQ